MKKGSSVMFLLVCLWLMACSGALRQEDYRTWVEDMDNGLHVQQDEGNYLIDVQYMPADYMWLQNPSGNRHELDSMEYYRIILTPKAAIDFLDVDVKTPEDRQRRLYYFSYLFQNDVLLEEDGIKKPCVMAHFESGADVQKGRRFVLGFESPGKPSGVSKLIINSEHLSSLPIVIKISKDNIPTLPL
jgi:hypothetical protein